MSLEEYASQRELQQSATGDSTDTTSNDMKSAAAASGKKVATGEVAMAKRTKARRDAAAVAAAAAALTGNTAKNKAETLGASREDLAGRTTPTGSPSRGGEDLSGRRTPTLPASPMDADDEEKDNEVVVDYEEEGEALPDEVESTKGSSMGPVRSETERKRSNAGSVEGEPAPKRKPSSGSEAAPEEIITNSTQESEDLARRRQELRQYSCVPWWHDEEYYRRCRGYRNTSREYGCFDTRVLEEKAPVKGVSAKELGWWWIDKFQAYRWWKGKMPFYTMAQEKQATATAQAWTQFVDVVLKGPNAWLDAYHEVRIDFLEHHIRGAIMRVHDASIDAALPCAAPAAFACASCLRGAPKLDETVHGGYDVEFKQTPRMTQNLITELDHLRNLYALRREGREKNNSRPSSSSDARDRTRGRHPSRPPVRHYDSPKSHALADTPANARGMSEASFDQGVDPDDQRGDPPASAVDRPRPSAAAAVAETPLVPPAIAQSRVAELEAANARLQAQVKRLELDQRVADCEKKIELQAHTVTRVAHEHEGTKAAQNNLRSRVEGLNQEIQELKRLLAQRDIYGDAPRRT